VSVNWACSSSRVLTGMGLTPAQAKRSASAALRGRKGSSQRAGVGDLGADMVCFAQKVSVETPYLQDPCHGVGWVY